MYPPSVVLTVITALPLLTAVTTPEVETDATDELDDDHATALFVAFDGLTVAESATVFPFSIVAEVLFKLTLVTAMFSVYVDHVPAAIS